MATGLTFVGNDILFFSTFNTDWLHVAPAFALPVPWIIVDMLAIEAIRAMVRISVSNDKKTAMLTGKVFNILLKCLAHCVKPL